MFYISHHLSITYVFRTKKANCIRYKIIKPSGFCKQIILNNLFSAICNFLITDVKVIFMYMVHTGGVHHINISPDPHVYGPLTETLVSTFLIEFGRRWRVYSTQWVPLLPRMFTSQDGTSAWSARFTLIEKRNTLTL